MSDTISWGLMSVEDVARALSVSPYSVRRWTAQRRLARVKLGGRTLYDPAEVKRFIDDAKAATQAA